MLKKIEPRRCLCGRDWCAVTIGADRVSCYQCALCWLAAHGWALAALARTPGLAVPSCAG